MKNARITDRNETAFKSTAASLAATYQELYALGFPKEAEALLELFEKVNSEQFAIAFCGHFSAGKSSMINELLGEAILPSSPIPTSANVVKLLSGPPSARITIRNKGTVKLAPPVDLNDVKRWAKNGEAIESIEMTVGETVLPQHVALFDTPGIDSTDDAHKVATESALHLADVVFYIMDYNHVLSQLNFSFVRLLKEQGKKLYLIVNQIDKHNEEELSFRDFQQKVRDGFKSWDIEPEDIFFTTIMEKEQEGNQLREIKALFQKFLLVRDDWIKENALKSAEHLIHKAVQAGLADEEEEEAETLAAASEVSEAALREEISRQTALVLGQQREAEALEKKAAKMFKDILDNAIMMPFPTRERAESYIESRQDGFKAGILFAGKKTEAERARRLEAFYTSVAENIETQISWHLKDYFKEYMMEMPAEPDITPAQLSGLVKPGASLSGNYVLQYCNDVTEEIKRIYTAHYRASIEQAKQKATATKVVELKKAQVVLSQYEKTLRALEAAHAISMKWNAIQKDLTSLLQEPRENEKAVARALTVLSAKEADESFLLDLEKGGVLADPSGEAGSLAATEKERVLHNGKSADLREEAQKLVEAANLLEGANLLETISSNLRRSADRITNREFTVSLFGAFSAGKSSFANALIGEPLLPVSPNPTTATINRILPPNERFPHGTAVIRFKDEAALLAEINQSLLAFGQQESTLSQAVEAAGKPKEKITDQLRPHLQFLHAVHRGYGAVQNQLGKSLTVGIDAFGAFAADEEKACFTESISVYYDCPLTKLGVTLVDTPGADSINARHTNVAFEFIKKSDAILYVTYYNHAFSAADREFLIQLGRVKDAFELDKMFFVVNASDLAKDEEELSDVTKHVASNLQQFGIRHPKLFALSSYYALLARKDSKQTTDHDLLKIQKFFGEIPKDQRLSKTGFADFYESLSAFLKNDLAQVLINSAHKQLLQARSTLKRLISQTEANEADQEKRKEKIEADLEAGLRTIAAHSLSIKEAALEKEIAELLFYVKQRVMLRFTEFFNEAFTSSVITGSVKEQKAALPLSLKELHKSIQFDLQQEARATVLRVENYIRSLLHSMNTELDEALERYEAPRYLMREENLVLKTLDIQTVLPAPDGTDGVLKEFKNARHFFEQDGKKLAMEKLQPAFDEAAGQFIKETLTLFLGYYIQMLQQHATAEKETREAEYQKYAATVLQAMESPDTVETMKRILRGLNEL